jgi:hypothetical protein
VLFQITSGLFLWRSITGLRRCKRTSNHWKRFDSRFRIVQGKPNPSFSNLSD